MDDLYQLWAARTALECWLAGGCAMLVVGIMFAGKRLASAVGDLELEEGNHRVTKLSEQDAMDRLGTAANERNLWKSKSEEQAATIEQMKFEASGLLATIDELRAQVSSASDANSEFKALCEDLESSYVSQRALYDESRREIERLRKLVPKQPKKPVNKPKKRTK